MKSGDPKAENGNNPNSNARAFRRASIPLLVQYRFDDIEDWQIDYAVDVSAGGVFMNTSVDRAIGDAVFLQVTSRDGSLFIQGQGTVVRTMDGKKAVQFDGFTDDDVAALDAYVCARARS